MKLQKRIKHAKTVRLIIFLIISNQLKITQSLEIEQLLSDTTIKNETELIGDNNQPLSLTLSQRNNSLNNIISNISVLSYADDNNYIRLNISWNLVNDEILKTSEHLRIVISNMDKCPCSFVFTDYPINEEFIVVPKLSIRNPADQIDPGCVYDIIFQSADEKTTIIYQVPDCVNAICDCNLHKPQAKLLGIEQITNDEFVVKWDPGIRTINDKNYTIQDINFSYGSKNLSSPRFVVENVENNFEKNYSILKLSHLIKEEEYILMADFFNNYDCYVVTTINFSVYYSTIFFIPIICIVVGLLLLWKYKLIIMLAEKLINMLRLKFSGLSASNETNVQLATISENSNMIGSMQINLQYISTELYTKPIDNYEFLPKNLTIIKEIGRGAFGHVYLGKALGIAGVEGYSLVAIKTLGENPTNDELQDFLSEIEIFKKIGAHPNIVTLLGCCTLTVPYMMIMEFVPCGNLQNYLINLRNQWCRKRNYKKFFPDSSDGAYIGLESETDRTLSTVSHEEPVSAETMTTELTDPDSPLLTTEQALNHILDPTELQNFAFQIAKGMSHLEQISITHRDLAARNILINEYKNLKISDFGLSRKGPYVNQKPKTVPLRWLAIESIQNHTYNSKTDVWSFGVVLWEIGTLGAFPYEQVPDTLVKHYLQNGNRLQRPEICTDDLYGLMLRCWHESPDERPSFRELVGLLDVKKRKVYVDFGQLNPTYVFPPTELDRISAGDVSKLCLNAT